MGAVGNLPALPASARVRLLPSFTINVTFRERGTAAIVFLGTAFLEYKVPAQIIDHRSQK